MDQDKIDKLKAAWSPEAAEGLKFDDEYAKLASELLDPKNVIKILPKFEIRTAAEYGDIEIFTDDWVSRYTVELTEDNVPYFSLISHEKCYR